MLDKKWGCGKKGIKEKKYIQIEMKEGLGASYIN